MTCVDGTCTTAVCGTGDWTGPKPGDPDNISSIQARGIVGAIEISWQLPPVNTHAVAFVKLFRGINSTFENAVERSTVSGNYFIDHFTDAEIRPYFYWLQLVSVNGTVYSVVGPATATPKSKKQEVLDSLTGEIEAGYLAQALQSEIGMIDALRTDLAQEVLDRVNANATLSSVLTGIQTGSDEARTLILNEIAQRQDADEALVKTANAIAAGLGNNTSAIVTEQETRTTADSALSQQVNILYSQTGTNIAAIDSEKLTRTTDVSALATRVDAMAAVVGANAAAISNEQIARVTADAVFTSTVDTLTAKADAIGAAVETVESAKIGYSVLRGTATPYDGDGVTVVYPLLDFPAADYPEYALDRKRIIDKLGVDRWNLTSAGIAKPLDWLVGLPLATSVKQVGIVDANGSYATVEQAFMTQKGLNDSFKAMYTAKVDVNGLVGGFGIYNNGTVVEAGFDVDKFWVGKAGSKTKPFIIDNGVVYIDKAKIREADIDTLKIANGAVSTVIGASGSDYWAYPVASTAWTDYGNSPVSITFSGTATVSGYLTDTPYTVTLTLKRDGVVIREAYSIGTVLVNSGFYVNMCDVFIDYPGPGGHQYTVTMTGGLPGNHNRVTLMAIGLKR